MDGERDLQLFPKVHIRDEGFVFEECRMIRIVLIPLVLLILQVSPDFLMAGERQKGDRHHRQHPVSRENHDIEDQDEGRVEEDADGNELTGQVAAWLLVSANLTVVFSVVIKGANRFLSLNPQRKRSNKALNQLQKKYLMRFHYLLNPMALSVAYFHFLLSSCRPSPVPEWGLVSFTILSVLGVALRFKATPKRMRRLVYRLHTAPAVFSIMIFLLVVGHLIVT
jgi:hypothetical protein